VPGRAGDADVVDQDVDRAEGVERTLDGTPARPGVRDLRVNEDGLAALADDDSAGLFGPVRTLVDEDDPRTVAGKEDRGGSGTASPGRVARPPPERGLRNSPRRTVEARRASMLFPSVLPC